MSDKISIIVPVYNVEHYLERCLLSVIGQEYSNLEVILVDDGSTDSSPLICDQFAAKYSFIQVFHQDNQGLSAARNTGIVHATGRYLCFLDSDDCIAANYVSLLYKLITTSKAQIGICGYLSGYEEGNPPFTKKEKLENVQIFNSEDAILRLYSNDDIKMVVAWNKIYEHTLFSNLEFKRGVYHEDEFIVHQVYSQAKRIASCDNELYYYQQRSNSIMDRSNSKKTIDKLRSLEERIAFCKIKGYRRAYQATCYKYQIELIRKFYAALLHGDKSEEVKKVLVEKELKFYKEFSNLRKRHKEKENKFRMYDQYWYLIHFYRLHYVTAKILGKHHENWSI